ncbi:MAG: ERCC4 domain-containing protein [Actinomycetota bacterium]
MASPDPEFVIARNPEAGSSLPYLVRIPLPDGPIQLKVKDTWPRTSKIYCHPTDAWPSPDELDVVERVPVRSCRRRGAAIDLVLDRHREHRSQFVFARARGRDVIFWQSARTTKQARPNVSLPTARAAGRTLEIVVDSNERYAWKFDHQQATTVRRKLPVGDYAVEAEAAAGAGAGTGTGERGAGGRGAGERADGGIIAVVERKSLTDLVATMTGGKLSYLLAELSTVPTAAVVVEDRYSAIFRLDRVRPAVVATGLGEAAARFPSVPILFLENRRLAQEWTYRFFGAAVEERATAGAAAVRAAVLHDTPPVPAAAPSVAEVRAWAVAAGWTVSDRGRLRAEVYDAYAAAHPNRPH